jgi:hypothetical protein
MDLFWREAALAHRHVMAMQVPADRLPRDAKALAKLVHRRPCLAARDELLYLAVVELPCSAGLAPTV